MSRDAHEKNSRWHCHVVSAEFATLLRHTNLPGPLGTPPGTLGPGAWIQRGATITIEGLCFSIQLRPSLSASLGQAVEQSECILSIGNLVIGTDRVIGGVVELQYEPLQRLSANSSLLGSLLVELLPPILSTVLRSVPIPKDDNLPLSNSAAVRTMLPNAQMEEIVPASLDEWRDPQHSQDSMDSNIFPAWESEQEYKPDVLGWSGFEQRRRMAFVYLNMLRSEGLA
ncbi:hypothetical protein MYAM1_000393 [Malassezia yamatoensis]|uniref:Mediator complex subunit 20 n=1 Tax=Malassezia yamatoensis TaxID=253288 RepID=A0AAJ5YWI5_9BASI|nr:hypothetical protein MYAM1_000393 [Malassezia yamatoensis]